jgi:lipoate-protein ligase A
MKGLSVGHYLDIYSTRKEMQEKGITNPSEQIKKFTNDFVEKLKALSLDEEIILNDHSFYDSKGDLIIKMPEKKLSAD